MKQYLYNVAIGLAFLSIIAGLGYIAYNIAQSISESYEFNARNFAIVCFSIASIHLSAILGKVILTNFKNRI